MPLYQRIDNSPERLAALCALLAAFLDACRMKSLAAGVALLGFVILFLGEDNTICERCTAYQRQQRKKNRAGPPPYAEPYVDITDPPPTDEDQPMADPSAAPEQPPPPPPPPTTAQQQHAVPVPPPADDEVYIHGLVVGDYSGQPDYRRFATTSRGCIRPIIRHLLWNGGLSEARDRRAGMHADATVCPSPPLGESGRRHRPALRHRFSPMGHTAAPPDRRAASAI